MAEEGEEEEELEVKTKLGSFSGVVIKVVIPVMGAPTGYSLQTQRLRSTDFAVSPSRCLWPLFLHLTVSFFPGEMYMETETIIELFMCGFILRVHMSFCCRVVLTARIHGQECVISLVQATYLQVIHLLY